MGGYAYPCINTKLSTFGSIIKSLSLCSRVSRIAGYDKSLLLLSVAARPTGLLLPPDEKETATDNNDAGNLGGKSM